MNEINNDQNTTPQKKTSRLANASIWCAVAGIYILLLTFRFSAGSGFAFLGLLVFLFAPLFGIAGIKSILLSKGRLKGMGRAIAGLVFSFAALCVLGGVFLLVINTFGRQEALRGVGGLLEMYASDHNDSLPPLDKWCDELVKMEVGITPKVLQFGRVPKGQCGYALNENLTGLKYSEIPDDMVVAFEAVGSWNLVGCPVLLGSKKHGFLHFFKHRHGVIFGDGNSKILLSSQCLWVD